MSKKKKEMLAVLLMLAVLTVFSVLIGNKKEWFHVDEIYSYNFVSQVKYPSVNEKRPDGAYRNVWHDPAYFEDYFTVSSEEAFDINGVYHAIIHDAHPPFYYILLHLTCSALFRNTFTFWSGLLLNLVFLRGP